MGLLPGFEVFPRPFRPQKRGSMRELPGDRAKDARVAREEAGVVRGIAGSVPSLRRQHRDGLGGGTAMTALVVAEVSELRVREPERQLAERAAQEKTEARRKLRGDDTRLDAEDPSVGDGEDLDPGADVAHEDGGRIERGGGPVRVRPCEARGVGCHVAADERDVTGRRDRRGRRRPPCARARRAPARPSRRGVRRTASRKRSAGGSMRRSGGRFRARARGGERVRGLGLGRGGFLVRGGGRGGLACTCTCSRRRTCRRSRTGTGRRTGTWGGCATGTSTFPASAAEGTSLANEATWAGISRARKG